MTDKAAILATFSDWRTVKSRKQLQIILEAPMEKQGEILTILGAPDPSNPKWVAIALLDKKLMEGQAPKGGVTTQDYSKLIQRAGILCTEPAFWRFMQTQGYPGCKDEHACADAMRMTLDVGSRRDLATNADARFKFQLLTERYQAWRRG